MRGTLSRLGALFLLLGAFWCVPVVAHESQPGLLELRQLTTERWEVIWRAPIYYGKPHPARLALPANWEPLGEPSVQPLASADLHRQVVTIPPDSLDGSVIGFPGLEQTITDVFVRLSRLDGSEASQVVRPTRPEAVLRGERPWHVTAEVVIPDGVTLTLEPGVTLFFEDGPVTRLTCSIVAPCPTITRETAVRSDSMAAAALNIFRVDPGSNGSVMARLRHNFRSYRPKAFGLNWG